MESEKYQKELFEFESPRKAKARFGSIFTRADFAITLTPEKMVFAAIGVIMLMVLCFALGVEKGRSSARAKFTSKKTAARDIVAEPVIVATEAGEPIFVTQRVAATNITPKNKPTAAERKAEAFSTKSKPYTIVAATFSREEFALKEVKRLKMAGFEAFVYNGEPYYLSCVGSFKDKSSAEKILKKVRQVYHDAYVKLR